MKEARSVAAMLGHSNAFMKRTRFPLNMNITGFKDGHVKTELEKMGFNDNWFFRTEEKDYFDLEGFKPENFVYLAING